MSLHHVTLEVLAADVEADVAFWAVLGFREVAAPAGLSGATWLECEGLQVHLAHRDAPVVPPLAHPAVVVADHAAVVAALGAAYTAREPHWGGARGYARSPSGHVVEVMSQPPPSSTVLEV